MTQVAVLAGTGKTGRAVCQALAFRGATGVPLGRDAWTGPGGLPTALRGCDAVYLIAPNLHPDEAAYVTDVVQAAHQAGVGTVVYHSVAAPYAPGLPHHLGKAAGEDVVRRSGLDWTILQPGAYLQNLDLTRTVTLPYRADAPFGFADLTEVARVAALVLLDRSDAGGHRGATYELASVASTVADLAAQAGVEVVVHRPSGIAAEGEQNREQQWLRAMFDYYDQHGLPVGTRVLRALLDAEPT